MDARDDNLAPGGGTAAAQPAQDPVAGTLVAQRLRLSHVQWGRPGARPLILLHGTRDHSRNWDWVADRLRADWHIIAPDLRGHGDSDWSQDGNYTLPAYVCDLAEFIHQLGQRFGWGPVHIIGHSLGAHIALRYAAVYPKTVARLVAIEGIGPRDADLQRREQTPPDERMRAWIERQRELAARQPRRYATEEDALARMREENRHLSDAQARHLTRHGVRRNEDGTVSWKFDNYVRGWDFPSDLTLAERIQLFAQITCPLLLVHGRESWASNPAEDGRAARFPNASAVSFKGAGHWVHHDQLDAFLDVVSRFLDEPDPG